jgi:hypothetical protein
MSEPIEMFIFCDEYWTVYCTDEGYPYYVTSSTTTITNDENHSQWGDPRIYGKYCQDFSTNEGASCIAEIGYNNDGSILSQQLSSTLSSSTHLSEMTTSNGYPSCSLPKTGSLVSPSSSSSSGIWESPRKINRKPTFEIMTKLSNFSNNSSTIHEHESIFDAEISSDSNDNKDNPSERSTSWDRDTFKQPLPDYLSTTNPYTYELKKKLLPDTSTQRPSINTENLSPYYDAQAIPTFSTTYGSPLSSEGGARGNRSVHFTSTVDTSAQRKAHFVFDQYADNQLFYTADDKIPDPVDDTLGRFQIMQAGNEPWTEEQQSTEDQGIQSSEMESFSAGQGILLARRESLTEAHSEPLAGTEYWAGEEVTPQAGKASMVDLHSELQTRTKLPTAKQGMPLAGIVLWTEMHSDPQAGRKSSIGEQDIPLAGRESLTEVLSEPQAEIELWIPEEGMPRAAKDSLTKAHSEPQAGIELWTVEKGIPQAGTVPWTGEQDISQAETESWTGERGMPLAANESWAGEEGIPRAANESWAGEEGIPRAANESWAGEVGIPHTDLGQTLDITHSELPTEVILSTATTADFMMNGLGSPQYYTPMEGFSSRLINDTKTFLAPHALPISVAVNEDPIIQGDHVNDLIEDIATLSIDRCSLRTDYDDCSELFADGLNETLTSKMEMKPSSGDNYIVNDETLTTGDEFSFIHIEGKEELGKQIGRILDDSFIYSSLSAPAFISSSPIPAGFTEAPIEYEERRMSTNGGRGMWSEVVEATTTVQRLQATVNSVTSQYASELAFENFAYSYPDKDYDVTGDFPIWSPTEEVVENASPSQPANDTSKHLNVWARFFENALQTKQEVPDALLKTMVPQIREMSESIEEDYGEWLLPLDEEEHLALMESVLSYTLSKSSSKKRMILSKAFLLAIVKDDADSVRALLEIGVNHSDVDDLIRTPLHYTCHSGSAEILAILNDAHVDLDARDVFGRTGLHIACIYNNSRVARFLLESAVIVDARDHVENTPLHLACRFGHLECCRLLVEYGASLEAKNIKRLNPMGEAKSAYAKNRRTGNIIEFLRVAFAKQTAERPTVPPNSRRGSRDASIKNEIMGRKSQSTKWGPPIFPDSEAMQEATRSSRHLDSRVEFEESPDGRQRPRLQTLDVSQAHTRHKSRSEDDSSDESTDDDGGGQGIVSQVIWGLASSLINVTKTIFSENRRRNSQSDDLKKVQL